MSVTGGIMTEFTVSERWSEMLNLELDEHSAFPRPFTYFDPKWSKDLDSQGYVNDGLNPEHIHFAHIGVGTFSVKIEDRDGAFGLNYFPGLLDDGSDGRFVKPNDMTCERLKLLMAVNGLQVLQSVALKPKPLAEKLLSELPRQRKLYQRLDAIRHEFERLETVELADGQFPYCLIWSIELDLALNRHEILSYPTPSTRYIDDVEWTSICNLSARVGDPKNQMGLYWRSGSELRRYLYGHPDFLCSHKGTIAPVPSVMQRFRDLMLDKA